MLLEGCVFIFVHLRLFFSVNDFILQIFYFDSGMMELFLFTLEIIFQWVVVILEFTNGQCELIGFIPREFEVFSYQV